MKDELDVIEVVEIPQYCNSTHKAREIIPDQPDSIYEPKLPSTISSLVSFNPSSMFMPKS